ncbi:hypothetical protein GQ53DRAFT_755971 [Thozetella sp. PMI_491]|nr:hypothetical protein GQ53DRAFT_755971 [Thozetella sp. PMI_491]
MGAYFGVRRLMEKAIVFDASVETDLALILAHLPAFYRRLLERALTLIKERAVGRKNRAEATTIQG